jgi:hypothetical protein
MKQTRRAFAKAVLAGTLTAGLPIAFFTVPFGILDYFAPVSAEPSLIADLYVAALPFLISFALVAAGSTLIGLPVDLLLRRRGLVSCTAYVVIGTTGGFLLTLATLVAIRATSGFALCFLGALSGAMTSLTWWKSIGGDRTSQMY